MTSPAALADRLTRPADSRPELPPGPYLVVRSCARRRARRSAIERVLRAAKPGDLVAIIGRGALPGQLIDRSGTWYEFDDRSVARELLDAC
jgi:UDP-N-acetylmuramyl tripeptide synthase